jgi:hypothetical protein
LSESAGIAIAGTPTSLGAIAQRASTPARRHSYVVSGPSAARSCGHCGRFGSARARRIPALRPARAPVILPGIVIFGAVMELFGIDALEVSEHGILRVALGLAGDKHELTSRRQFRYQHWRCALFLSTPFLRPRRGGRATRYSTGNGVAISEAEMLAAEQALRERVLRGPTGEALTRLDQVVEAGGPRQFAQQTGRAVWEVTHEAKLDIRAVRDVLRQREYIQDTIRLGRYAPEEATKYSFAARGFRSSGGCWRSRAMGCGAVRRWPGSAAVGEHGRRR